MPDDRLKPGEVETCGGGVIRFDVQLRKFEICDASGHLHGYRVSIEKARELASAIPSAPSAPTPPPVLSRSPTALPLPASQGVPPSIPKDARADFFTRHDRSPWRMRNGLRPSGSAPRVILRVPKARRWRT